MMKFAWTRDGPWRALEEGVRVQARRKGRAWTCDRPWRAVEGRCVVQANFINAEAEAEVREACWILDRLHQKRRFLREACWILDRLHHPAPG